MSCCAVQSRYSRLLRAVCNRLPLLECGIYLCIVSDIDSGVGVCIGIGVIIVENGSMGISISVSRMTE